jgi:hypothetical protein
MSGKTNGNWNIFFHFCITTFACNDTIDGKLETSLFSLTFAFVGQSGITVFLWTTTIDGSSH